jgi:serine/threonine protein kinase
VGVEGNKAKIKICEFSLAQVSSPEVKLHGECGAPLFMSPEMVSKSGYTTKTDIWSFGIIVYALLFGRFPFDCQKKDSYDMRITIASMTEVISFASSARLSLNCIAFAMSLLEKDPSIRPTASDALQKSYMTDVIAEEHLLGQKIADLRPMLEEVRKFRGFEHQETGEKSDIDDVLNRHQLAKHGIPLPKLKDVPVVVGAVSNLKAKDSAQKLGEAEKRFFACGSPDLAHSTMRIGKDNSVTALDKLEGRRALNGASSSWESSMRSLLSDGNMVVSTLSV